MLVSWPSPIPPLRMLVTPVLAKLLVVVAALTRGELEHVGAGRHRWRGAAITASSEVVHPDVRATIGLGNGGNMEVRRSIGGIEARQELIGVTHAFAQRIGIGSTK